MELISCTAARTWSAIDGGFSTLPVADVADADAAGALPLAATGGVLTGFAGDGMRLAGAGAAAGLGGSTARAALLAAKVAPSQTTVRAARATRQRGKSRAAWGR
jgi:hypothetical protein